MIRTLLSIAFIAFAGLVFGQDCEPDLSYADSTAGVYPKPYDAATNPNGGITECAVIGQPFSFNLTVVINDTLKIGTLSFNLDSIIISQVNGLPTGLNYACEPTNCHFLRNTINCATIYGTPTAANAPGAYDMIIKGSAYVNGSSFPLPLEFPNDQIAPGKYTIHLNANAADPCAVTGTSELAKQLSIKTVPNPVHGIAQIKINSQISGQFQFQLIDLLGNQIEQRQVSLMQGENSIGFEANSLPNGLYLAQLHNESGQVTQKIVVQH